MNKSTAMNRRQMIDTVRFYQSRTYSYPLSLKSAVVAGGAFHSEFKVKPAAGADTFVVIHKRTGLRAKFCGQILQWVEVSLPRLLFGNNGRLLSWQRDIDAALRETDAILDELSIALYSCREFRRVDLVWQFKGDPKTFANAHRNCRHPMVHRPAIDYGNNGLEWRGSKLKIKMYDKLLEQTKKPGNVIRVEVQLRGKAMKSLLATGAQVTSLDFGTCYRVYRSIVQKFSPKLVPRITDTIDLLAFALYKHGVNLWPHWKRHYKNPQSRNRARKEFLARKLHYSQIDWSKLLPLNRPSRKAEIDRSGRSSLIILAHSHAAHGA